MSELCTDVAPGLCFCFINGSQSKLERRSILTSFVRGESYPHSITPSQYPMFLVLHYGYKMIIMVE